MQLNKLNTAEESKKKRIAQQAIRNPEDNLSITIDYVRPALSRLGNG